MLEKLLEKIKSSLRIWMHINFLKVNGGVDPCAALRARVARLEDALKGVLPPEHGEYGGPLVEMVARYEDGSPTERITPLLAKMHIGHEAIARARRALEEK